MNTTRPETTLGQDLVQFARYHLRGWRGLLAAAVLPAIPALWLGGPWLIAAGAIPLLISLAPCLVMCAVGLCAMRKCNKPTARDAGADAPAPTSAPAVAPVVADARGEAKTSPRH